MAHEVRHQAASDDHVRVSEVTRRETTMWQEMSADDLGSVLSLLQDEWRDLENGLIEFVGDRYLSADKKRTLAAAALNAELDATRALIRGNRLAQRGVGTSVLRP